MAPLHLLYISIPLVLTAVLYLIFRHRSAATKWTLVFLLTLINATQHLLKPYIYPQYEGMSFGAMCTAYNMCALLILMSPIVMLVGSQLWRDFVLYIGAIAGIGSILTTYWLAAPMEEQIRFVICHGLLFVSSLLPALLGVYHANWRKFLKLPFVFFACLLILIVSNIINYELGIVGDVGDMTLGEFLYRENPCWSMCPPAGYSFVTDLVKPFTPPIFLTALGGVDTPIMWFFFPMIILFWVCGFFLGIIFDGKRMGRDFLSALKWIFRRNKKKHKKTVK